MPCELLEYPRDADRVNARLIVPHRGKLADRDAGDAIIHQTMVRTARALPPQIPGRRQEYVATHIRSSYVNPSCPLH